MVIMTDGLWTAWTTRKRNRVAHPAHSPYGDEVALFSMIKWPCFQLSRCKQDGQNGPLFGDQMALFSVDKNTRWILLHPNPSAAFPGLLGL
jgi:hypothetical protein